MLNIPFLFKSIFQWPVRPKLHHLKTEHLKVPEYKLLIEESSAVP